MKYTQVNRRIEIATPLGRDTLLLKGFRGSEALSQLFLFDLDLLSEDDSLAFQDIVGKEAAIRVSSPGGVDRYWHGFISRFSQGPRVSRFTSYRAQMVPWLWFLTRTSDCRIFQNEKAPDIIQKIFTGMGFRDFELRLYGAFPEREYCVQYMETDFNFVSRLMEQEGIHYFFEHQHDKHVLVLANDPVAHHPCPEQAHARYASGNALAYEDVITEWSYEEAVRPGKWTQTDYNFETPSVDLTVSLSGKNPFEIYHYPGKHQVRSEGERLSRIRLQEQTAMSALSRGASGCRHFSTGSTFTLQNHYRGSLNQSYLLTAIQHSASQEGDFGLGIDEVDELTYSNQFECIPSSVPFCPPRVTAQPVMQGCQTAVVVGPAGEEIYTDKHGRVKVQFHWDRVGKRDENSSCWIRVSHPSAGKGWGSITTPRIGQEVVVDFLEGDPDQPLIVGRVYNAEQPPPFGMPGGSMVSGMKSNSTKGGGGFNEMSMNDTKGKEMITVHAQYDHSTTVEHDHTATVHNNRTSTVDVDDSESIGSNQVIKVGTDQTSTVGANQKTSVGASRTVHVSADETKSVGGAQTITVTGAQTMSVSASRTTHVSADHTETVGGTQSVTVTGPQKILVAAARTTQVAASDTEIVGGGKTVTITGAHQRSVSATDSLTVGATQTVSVTGAIEISSGASITLSAGGSKIVIGPSGIEMTSGGIISLKASLVKNNT